MRDVPVGDVRSFAILGHTGSGKTTLVDSLLFKMGECDRAGAVTNGSSLADYTNEEKNHKITIFPKPFEGIYKNPAGRSYSLVFIDTPGYADFFGHMVAACHAVETGLIVVDASAGVQVGTRRAWRCCSNLGLAKAVVVTGLDRENASFDRAVQKIQEVFGGACVPVTVPSADGGIVDVMGDNVPDSMKNAAEETRNRLVELAAETDEELTEKYIGGEELTTEEISRGLEAASLSGGFVPVFACKPLKDVGLNELMEGIARYTPHPRVHQDAEGRDIPNAADAPFVGYVWRSMQDPFVGQLSFVRVLAGTLKGDSEVLNASKDHKERFSAIMSMKGRTQTPVASAGPGDIVAIPKLKATEAGDTLCAVGSKVVCKRINFPKAVTTMAVHAKTQADEDKLSVALARVSQEDPTLKIERNKETKETLISGLGDVHVEIAVELMKSRSNAEVTLTEPRMPYRETVTAVGEGHYKHKKQSGGRGQYGEVYLRIMPKRADEEDWFVDKIVGGAIPGNFLPAIQKGLLEGMQSGAVAGYPVTNVKVEVYDGSYHDVDSSEIAFKIAGSRAMKDGMTKAKPVLLEPIMKVRVTIPDSNMGDINGDLNHKRGRILGVEPEAGMQTIVADVPLAELNRYAAELRSMTGGQGSFEMEFSRYDIVPSNIAQKIIAESDRQKEEE